MNFESQLIFNCIELNVSLMDNVGVGRNVVWLESDSGSIILIKESETD